VHFWGMHNEAICTFQKCAPVFYNPLLCTTFNVESSVAFFALKISGLEKKVYNLYSEIITSIYLYINRLNQPRIKNGVRPISNRQRFNPPVLFQLNYLTRHSIHCNKSVFQIDTLGFPKYL